LTIRRSAGFAAGIRRATPRESVAVAGLVWSVVSNGLPSHAPPSGPPFGGEPGAGICVVGAGLAGCEAAWQAARRGVQVRLVEMKPQRMSPAHGSEDCAELVCSNSLRGASIQNAVGLLKEEMRQLDSLILRAADATAVPAGRALAVDRHAFSRFVTEAVESHPAIRLEHRAVDEIPDDPYVILATGPLTDPPLARAIQGLLGDESLYFYDAIAPTVYADSIDYSVAFRASRYEEGEGDYLNLPLSREEYETFVAALVAADTVPLHPFEAALYFEGCLPIEEMARRGPQTLSFGPMKPVGLVDPRTGKRPFAVVQLRQEDKAGVLFNLVGFQTKLRISDQKRIFRSLPGMSEAVFARLGSVHRNTYVNAPKRLAPGLEVANRPGLYLAGQMAGVEGYVESAALGLIAGINASHAIQGRPPILPPPETAHGALLNHLSGANPDAFQPMNVNYGLFPPLTGDAAKPATGRKLKRREKVERMAERALEGLRAYRDEVNSLIP
jgi:methylenetetrahydrofolate--tRNA-(uracil-5-)-methyltransferase